MAFEKKTIAKWQHRVVEVVYALNLLYMDNTEVMYGTVFHSKVRMPSVVRNAFVT